jgi:hypothetical protein
MLSKFGVAASARCLTHASASSFFSDDGVCTENFIRVDDAPESPKLAE